MLKTQTINMKNITLTLLSEFIRNNYEELKADYNKLDKEQKSRLPIALFIIQVFDNLLTAQSIKNEKTVQPETASPAPMEANNDTPIEG